MIDYGDTVLAPQALGKKSLRTKEVFDGPQNQGELDSPQAEEKDLVLIIDDSPAMVEVLSDVLHFLNCQVLAALNGDEGLSIFEDYQDSISLVILDMNMPVLTGEETLRRLRMQDPNVRVIVSSSLSEEEARRRCSAQGEAVPYFLQKPYELDQAVDLLQTALSS